MRVSLLRIDISPDAVSTFPNKRNRSTWVFQRLSHSAVGGVALDCYHEVDPFLVEGFVQEVLR